MKKMLAIHAPALLTLSRRNSLRPLLCLAAWLAAGAAPAAAQTGAVRATILVVEPTPNWFGTKSLAFGTLAPGIAETVGPLSLQAGEARGIGADGYRSITLTLALPTRLTGPGGTTLALDFNGPYAASCELSAAGVCDPASRETWNPAATPTRTDTPHNRGPGNRYRLPGLALYIGGRAVPSPSQRAGTYTGSITVTAVAN